MLPLIYTCSSCDTRPSRAVTVISRKAMLSESSAICCVNDKSRASRRAFFGYNEEIGPLNTPINTVIESDSSLQVETYLPSTFLCTSRQCQLDSGKGLSMIEQQSKQRKELTSPVFSSTVMMCPNDSCNSLTGTPRLAIIIEF